MSLSFGFEDGVSQPLLEGIDKPDVIAKNKSMKTPQSVITVGEGQLPAGLTGGKVDRPEWMLDGSFLVFRKFEQDVGKFQKLAGEFKSAGCISADQFGARLMGRWQSGRCSVVLPIVCCYSEPG
jgi:deferrochelatase/peroxidase EfeB